jgi:hypothetical protein
MTIDPGLETDRRVPAETVDATKGRTGIEPGALKKEETRGTIPTHEGLMLPSIDNASTIGGIKMS